MKTEKNSKVITKRELSDGIVAGGGLSGVCAMYLPPATEPRSFWSGSSMPGGNASRNAGWVLRAPGDKTRKPTAEELQLDNIYRTR